MTTKITISANGGWPVLVTSRLGGQNSSAETSTVNPGATQEFNIHAGNELVIRELSGSGVKPADIRDPSDPRPMAPIAPGLQEAADKREAARREADETSAEQRKADAKMQRAREENEAQLKLEGADKKPEPVKLAGVSQGPLTPPAKPATTITQ